MTDLDRVLPETASNTLRKMADAALQAGDLLLEASADRSTLRIDQKSAGDFVSEADRATDALIARLLGDAHPDYGWLSEESDARPSNKSDLRWIVDPLDGTTNFLKGLPHWAVSIALCRAEETICAVVHDPAKMETFVAEKGSGTYLNESRVRVTQGVRMKDALFAMGVPSGGRVTYLPDCLDDLERLMPKTAGARHKSCGVNPRGESGAPSISRFVHVWMPSLVQVIFERLERVIGCGHVSGLSMRR